MDKNDRIFRLLALAGVGLGLYALIRYEFLLYKTSEMIDLIKTEVRFNEIMEQYNQEGEQP